jgi:hypothetical protein
MSRPLIQIDDLVREMTEEEYERYQAIVADMAAMPKATDETPSAD